MKAQRGSRGIALPFLDLDTEDAGGWSALRPGRFTPGKDPVPIVHEAGLVPGPVWTGAENLAPNGIRSPDRPARSAVTIPTELSRPFHKTLRNFFYLFIFCKINSRFHVFCNNRVPRKIPYRI